MIESHFIFADAAAEALDVRDIPAWPGNGMARMTRARLVIAPLT